MRERTFFALHRAARLCLLCSAGLAACSSGRTAAAPNPPPEVGVVTLHPQPVTITTDLPGRLAAYRVAEVRPQVSGVIVKRLFTEGSEVKAGQQLYQIDPAPFQANLESAQASLARARATLKSAALLIIDFGFVGLRNGSYHDLAAGTGLYGNSSVLRVDGNVGIGTDVEPIFLARLGHRHRSQTGGQRESYNGGLL